MLLETAVRSSPPPAALKGSGRGSPGCHRHSIAQKTSQALCMRALVRNSVADVFCCCAFCATPGACTLPTASCVVGTLCHQQSKASQGLNDHTHSGTQEPCSWSTNLRGHEKRNVVVVDAGQVWLYACIAMQPLQCPSAPLSTSLRRWCRECCDKAQKSEGQDEAGCKAG